VLHFGASPGRRSSRADVRRPDLTWQALALVLVSAGAHATWNLLARRSQDRLVFLWLMNVSAAVVLLPFALWRLSAAPPLPGGWIFILGTGALHVLYFYSLGRSYSSGDLSVVYPVARGTGPLLVTIAAIPLLGEVPSWLGAIGVLLVVGGVYTTHARGFALSDLLAPIRSILRDDGSRFALITGVIIACYTLWDRFGVGLVDPLLYGYFVFAIPGIVVAPVMLRLRAAEVAAMARTGLRWCVLAACLGYLAYGLVLTAFTLAPVAYVAATREVGIVIGSLLGVVVLREPHGRGRVLGSAAICLGVIAIAVAR
jgi:drug/metabolite transporter (DMT)-like permease